MIAKLTVFLCVLLPFAAAGTPATDDCAEMVTPTQLAQITLELLTASPSCSSLVQLREYFPLNVLSCLNISRPILVYIGIPGQDSAPLLEVLLGCDLYNILTIDYGSIQSANVSSLGGVLGRVIAGLLDTVARLLGAGYPPMRIVGTPATIELCLNIANLISADVAVTLLGSGGTGGEQAASQVCLSDEEYQTTLSLNALDILLVELGISL